MVVISLDAVGARDLAYLKTLPNFQKLRAQSGYCDHVESVYPSITYPAHTSIVTGKKPLHHGVVNNLQLQPGRKSPDWMWQSWCHRKLLGDSIYPESSYPHDPALLLEDVPEVPIQGSGFLPWCGFLPDPARYLSLIHI